MWHVARSQGITWGIGLLCLLLLFEGETNHVLALPLVAHGNHAGENHAGEVHAGENLGSINLTGANLSETNFSGAFFQNANFTNANFSGTSFRNADLEDSLLVGAVLTPETTFSGASLRDADLSNTDLCGALDLSRAADLSYTRFSRSNLSGLTLSGFDNLWLDEAILNKANLRFSVIETGENANLTGADLRHAFLDDAWLTNANFTNADLRFVVAEDTMFFHANFTNADLRFANLHGFFAGAVFTGANIYGATFRTTANLDLTGAISDPHPTPEPSTWLLLGTGLVGLVGYGWWRRHPTP